MQETSHLTHPSSSPLLLNLETMCLLLCEISPSLRKWAESAPPLVSFPSLLILFLSPEGRLPVMFDHPLSPLLSIDEKALFTLSFPVPTREFCRHRPFIHRNFSLIHQSELPYLSSLSISIPPSTGINLGPRMGARNGQFI